MLFWLLLLVCQVGLALSPLRKPTLNARTSPNIQLGTLRKRQSFEEFRANAPLVSAFYSKEGRKYVGYRNEDRVLFVQKFNPVSSTACSMIAIFDGHGRKESAGEVVAITARRVAKSFFQSQIQYYSHLLYHPSTFLPAIFKYIKMGLQETVATSVLYNGGTTATIGFLVEHANGTAYFSTGNLGDSRAVMAGVSYVKGNSWRRNDLEVLTKEQNIEEAEERSEILKRFADYGYRQHGYVQRQNSMDNPLFVPVYSNLNIPKIVTSQELGHILYEKSDNGTLPPLKLFEVGERYLFVHSSDPRYVGQSRGLQLTASLGDLLLKPIKRDELEVTSIFERQMYRSGTRRGSMLIFASDGLWGGLKRKCRKLGGEFCHENELAVESIVSEINPYWRGWLNYAAEYVADDAAKFTRDDISLVVLWLQGLVAK